MYRYDMSVARRGETIELAVLGLLHESPMHGYELRKRLNLHARLGPAALLRLALPGPEEDARAAWIEERTVPTGAVSRRPRIVYQLTATGQDEFVRLMSEVGPTAWEDDNFDIRFAFFGRTDMEIRLRVLEGRRSRLQERLERVQGQLSLTQKEVDRYAARAPAPRRRVGRTGGPLALGPHQRRARSQQQSPPAASRGGGTTTDLTSKHQRDKQETRKSEWVRYA